MKPTLALRSFLLGTVFLAAATSLHAAVRYWDGATPGGDAGGGTGTWADATSNWSTAATGGSATTFTNVTDSAIFGGTGATVTLGVARTAAGITFTTGSYDVDTNNKVLTIGSGGITVTSGAGSQVRIGNGTANSGRVTLSASQVWLNESDQDLQQRDGNLVLGANTLTLNSTGGGRILASGTTSGAGNIIVSANTSAGMSGLNSYSGTTTINSGGILTVNSLGNFNAAGGLGTKASNLASDLVIDGGTLRVQVASNTSDRLFTVGAGGATFEAINTGGNSGQIQFTDTTAVSYSGTGNRTITIGGTSDDSGGSSIARVIGDVGGGNGTVALAKTGSHDWTVSGTNTFTGGTSVSAGTLTMGSASALGSTSGQLTVNTGGTLNMVANNLTVGNLTGTGGTISGTSGTRLLTIGQGNGGGGNFQGAITNGTGGTTALTKTGSGTITLSGTNTYTGATNVDGGTLEIGTTGSTDALSAFTVSNSGSALIVNGTLNGTLLANASTTLSGTGTIQGNAIIQGTHNPGNSPGIQTYGANLTYSGGASVVNWELNGNTVINVANPNAIFDQIFVGGNLDFTNLTTLNLAFNGAGSGVLWANSLWDTDQSWTIFDVTGTTTNFNNLSLTTINWLDSGSNLFDTTGGIFSLSQAGNNVMLNYNVVPEPSATLLGGLGLLALLRRRR